MFEFEEFGSPRVVPLASDFGHAEVGNFRLWVADGFAGFCFADYEKLVSYFVGLLGIDGDEFGVPFFKEVSVAFVIVGFGNHGNIEGLIMGLGNDLTVDFLGVLVLAVG